MLNKVILSITLLLVSVSSFANPEHQKIAGVIQKYFDGSSKGKPHLLSEAFTDSLELQHVKEGKLVRWQGADYISRFKPGKTNGRIGNIVSIDVTGNAAVVKATIKAGKTLFTDYLLLLKLEAGWKITNKTFTKQKLN
ncbi:nuclear transport factor 2 family protein [Thalassotalea sp. M1531]|uniref:Nuclear transport factor 2 family protein n=1 Tax=Thalassotalea algicola TaxID=2716224 RepID=A0A7Y0LCE7_9GAMM|nr:nuclear transport factor 2 family protein [Thalassotalea algicola]NMP31111.1 nuclear transport factor 2 family protein [Thalassotalea algicola]